MTTWTNLLWKDWYCSMNCLRWDWNVFITLLIFASCIKNADKRTYFPPSTQSKEMLSEFMRNGFYQLSSTRKSLGQHAVSALRIPETIITASTKTLKEESFDESLPKVSFEATEVIAVDDAKHEEGNEGLEEEVKSANRKPINWFSANLT